MKPTWLGFVVAVVTLFALSTPASARQGDVKHKFSKVDGSHEVTMLRIDLKNIELGAFWHSSMAENEVELVLGRRRGEGIKSGPSFHVNIDGTLIDVEATDDASKASVAWRPFAFGSGVRIERNFRATVDLLQRMIASKEIGARLDLDNGSVDSPMENRKVDFRKQLTEFLTAVEKAKADAKAGK